MLVCVKDKEFVGRDKLLGQCEMDLSSLASGESSTQLSAQLTNKDGSLAEV